MAMKITIEQLDIEQAIKNYIGSMLDIKEGAHLDIDLAATRGSAGFTATINIRNADEPRRESVENAAVQKEPDAELPAKIDGRTKAGKALNIPKVNELPKEEVSETDNASDVQGKPTVNEEEPLVESPEVTVDEKVEETVNQDDSEEAPDAPVRASLFGGLKAPKN